MVPLLELLDRPDNQPSSASAMDSDSLAFLWPLGQSARELSPARHDLERLVTAEWCSLLIAPDLDVQLEVDAPEIGVMIRREAQRLSDAWPTLELAAQRRALLASGLGVTAGRTQLRLSFAREGLLALLEGTPISVH